MLAKLTPLIIPVGPTVLISKHFQFVPSQYNTCPAVQSVGGPTEL